MSPGYKDSHIQEHIQQLEGPDLTGDAEGQHHHSRHHVACLEAPHEDKPDHAEEVRVEVAQGGRDHDDVVDEWDS